MINADPTQLHPVPVGKRFHLESKTPDLWPTRESGNVEATLEARLGRRLNPTLAGLGRLLFFDNS